MNKRGQFYIITAIIIAMILSGITGIMTYAIIKPSQKSIQDLGSTLREETPRIIDYGIYNNKDWHSIMNNFTTQDFAYYFLEKTDYDNATFIYGDKSKIYKIDYIKGIGGTIYLGGSQIQIAHSDVKKEEITVNPGQDSIDVKILRKNYKFKLKENEMFYFVIARQKEGEVFIEENAEKEKK